MDNILVPYLTARDEQERQLLLSELVTIRAAPLIRQALRRRLGFYVSAQGVNENNQDAEDLYQESMARVVQVLHQLMPREEVFFRGYLNDLLLIPCLLPPILLVHRKLSWRQTDRSPSAGEIFIHLTIWSLLFEYIGPTATLPCP